MKQAHVLMGVIGCFTIGATLGVLFAPDKGSNTRGKISKNGNKLKDTVKGTVDYLVSTAENKYGHITSAADKVMNTGKQTVEKVAASL